MSINNTPTVIVGKLFNREEIPDSLYEKILDGEWGRLSVVAGETHYQRPAIGFIINSMDKYAESVADILFDSGKALDETVDEVIIALMKAGLPVGAGQVGLYFMDVWG